MGCGASIDAKEAGAHKLISRVADKLGHVPLIGKLANMYHKEEEDSKKEGEVTSEALQWFIERDARTLSQAAAFVPWVIQHGVRLGTLKGNAVDVRCLFGCGITYFQYFLDRDLSRRRRCCIL